MEALAPLEEAILDHHRGGAVGPLRLRFDDGRTEEVPAAWFFRTEEELDALDRAALGRCRGAVLDVGAGAGAHALSLQRRGLTVTALELLPGVVRVLRERGVRSVREGSVWTYEPPAPFDTVLLLMNGTGLAGTLPRLSPLLGRARSFLAPGGRVLIDSTDPGEDAPDDGRHPGELQIQLEYGGRRGPPFPHLYVGPTTLAAAAEGAGLEAEVVFEEPDGRYLAACTPLTA